MKRLTLISSVAMALVIAVPMAVTASAAEAEPPSEAEPALVDSRLEPIRLRCGVRSADAGQFVGCEWSQPTSATAVAVKLYRFDPAVDPHRQVVYRSGDLSQTHFRDIEVRPGHRYVYALVVFDANGRVVGRSRAEWVRVPQVADPDLEVLRLTCRLGDANAWIGCEWSHPTSRDAAVVSLWRSVDGGERVLVERFRPAGPNTYREAVPAGAHRVTYTVIATNDGDRIVARSRPETVGIPHPDLTADTRPADVQPANAEPVDTQPVSAAPVVAEPVSVEPVSVEPVSVEPVDSQPVSAQPVDSQLASVEPVAARPVGTQPADTRPASVDRQSADTRPVNARPVGSRASVDTRP